ncbi:hypothetical protein ACFX13_030930 [Malus domestica]
MNCIRGLEGTFENCQEKEEGRIGQIMVQHFGALFGSTQPRRVQKVLECNPMRLTTKDNLELLEPIYGKMRLNRLSFKS